MVLRMKDCDVILGMYWLATHHTLVDCFGKRGTFQILGQEEFSFFSSRVGSPPRVISFM